MTGTVRITASQPVACVRCRPRAVRAHAGQALPEVQVERWPAKPGQPTRRGARPTAAACAWCGSLTRPAWRAKLHRRRHAGRLQRPPRLPAPQWHGLPAAPTCWQARAGGQRPATNRTSARFCRHGLPCGNAQLLLRFRTDVTLAYWGGRTGLAIGILWATTCGPHRPRERGGGAAPVLLLPLPLADSAPRDTHQPQDPRRWRLFGGRGALVLETTGSTLGC